jgi:hypothetical protein
MKIGDDGRNHMSALAERSKEVRETTEIAVTFAEISFRLRKGSRRLPAFAPRGPAVDRRRNAGRAGSVTNQGLHTGRAGAAIINKIGSLAKRAP